MLTTTDLRKLLEKEGVSQRELARRLDVNDRTVRHWCAGSKIPRTAELAIYYLFRIKEP